MMPARIDIGRQSRPLLLPFSPHFLAFSGIHVHAYDFRIARKSAVCLNGISEKMPFYKDFRAIMNTYADSEQSEQAPVLSLE